MNLMFDFLNVTIVEEICIASDLNIQDLPHFEIQINQHYVSQSSTLPIKTSYLRSIFSFQKKCIDTSFIILPFHDYSAVLSLFLTST